MIKQIIKDITGKWLVSLFSKYNLNHYWDNKLNERLKYPVFLENYSYKVFSQNDEDGIIAEIFRRISTTDKRFIEFGVETGIESNSHLLLMLGWSGLWIEADKKAHRSIKKKFDAVIKRGLLQVHNGFINCETINQTFEQYGFTGQVDLLSIDIDGNDYHVWQAISGINPRCVIIEYNPTLPPDCEWIMRYNPKHRWDRSSAHGASLKSLEKLGSAKGYKLVGTNIAGVNSFFVRKDLTKDLFPSPATAENLYNPYRCIAHPILHRTKSCLLNF